MDAQIQYKILNVIVNRENYIEQTLQYLFNQEMQDLSIGYSYNNGRIHLMMDIINLLDYMNFSDRDAETLIKYTRYYEQLLNK